MTDQLPKCEHEFQPIDSSGQRACLYCNERERRPSTDQLTEVDMLTDLDQYRCQPEKRVYCPHLDGAHGLLAEWLRAWSAGVDDSQLFQRTAQFLSAKRP